MSTTAVVKKSAVKKPKAPKAASHPSYFEMIKEAILGLKEKSGSSPHAIAKYMEEKQKSVLPPNFRKVLAVQLKNSAAKGKLIKIKASFKLSEAGKKLAAPKKPAAKAKVVKKPAAKAVAGAVKKPAAKSVVAKKEAGAVKKAAPKPKTKVVSKKRAAPVAKPKVPKSIKSPAAKRAKRVSSKA